MKTTVALAITTLSLAACAAPAADDTSAETVETANLATTVPAAPAAPVYRGAFEANGARFALEVVVTSKQAVTQTKYCDPGSEGSSAFAGAYASPRYFAGETGGVVRTIVRDAAGAVIAESSYDIAPFSASSYNHDVATQCKKGGRFIANFEPTTTMTYADPLIWVPGVVAETKQGTVWINPSYGGPSRVPTSFQGTATYRALSSETSLHPRPFSGEGQELVFAKGELTFHPGVPSISLEVGTDIDPTGSHARDRHTVALVRE